MNLIRVALDVPVRSLFDYWAPQGSACVPGMRVHVPFGSRQVVGVVVEMGVKSELPLDRVKPALRAFEDDSILPGDILKLLRFCSDYYHHPLGESIMNAIPVGLRRAREAVLEHARHYALTEAGHSADLSAALPRRRLVAHKIMERLKACDALEPSDLRALSARAPAAMSQLIERGWVVLRNAAPAVKAGRVKDAQGHELNEEQSQAVGFLCGTLGQFKVSLLHGVTGSGKTEVYLRVMAEALKRGGQVLILVPEINLTPQMETLFKSRFSGHLLVTQHSGLAVNERTRNWLLARSGQADIVLGTRLGVFTPLPRLAMIIVDEEHDPSFKQQEGLRYSARDVAIFRAREAGVPIVLGSATPSLEAWHNALNGRFQLLQLKHRAHGQASLPEVKCVDLRTVPMHDGLSQALLDAIAERLKRREQSLLFINRRGFAPVMLCRACSWVSSCARCSSRLVVHRAQSCLRCHYCGHEEVIPRACPSCGNQDLASLGQGTQRVEATLHKVFPEARILRIDRDTTRRKHAWSSMAEEIRQHRVDIMVGTQMLAKGHDFSNITLVGIVNPDGALFSTDFRASERLFSQLMQVGGRAGRGSAAGEVIVQTQFPDHPLYRALQRHEFEALAEALLLERKQAGFPPFVYQALLRAEATQAGAAMEFLNSAARAAEGITPEVMIYDPVPATVERIAGMERAQLLVQCSSRARLQAFLTVWEEKFSRLAGNRVRWSLDVDPVEL